MAKKRKRNWPPTEPSAKKRKRNWPPTESSTSVNDLSDDLLEVVLLDLDSPVCLVRAASTCKRWRHIVAGAAFLRRFRSLHPPRAIGHFYNVTKYSPYSFGCWHAWPKEGEAPVYVPESMSAADGIYGRQLSLDFVPCDGTPPEIVDSRGSLLLLLKEKFGTAEHKRDCSCCNYLNNNIVPDLVVCEPLTRRYHRIDPPKGHICIISAFLLDGNKAGRAIGMDNFRVLLVLYIHDRDWTDRYNGHGYVYASVFPSRWNNGSWYHSRLAKGVYLPRVADVQFAGRTGGRIYWACSDDQKVLVLDERTLKFSYMALPDHMKWDFDANNFRVVAGEGGTMRILRVTDSGDLEVFSQVRGCFSTEDWVLESRVRLAEATRGLRRRKEEFFAKPPRIIIAGEEGSVILSPVNKMWLFSVDLDTLELKRERRRNKYAGRAFPCMPSWPPLMLASVEKGRKRRKKKASS
ncbi:hypothetical protein EJB05_42614, partial [Eragrostis curvula]